MTPEKPTVEAKLAEAGLTVFRRNAGRAENRRDRSRSRLRRRCAGPVPFYLQEPIHALRLWTK